MSVKQFIIYMIFEVIGTTLIMLTYSNLYEKENEFKLKNFLIIILESILIIINNYFNIPQLRIIISIIITFTFLKIYFNSSFNKTITFTIINALVALFAELFTSIILLGVTDINTLNNSIFIKSFYSLINSILVYAIISKSKLKKIFKKISDLIETKLNMCVFFAISLALINSILIYRAVNLKEKPFILISIIFSMFVIYCIITIVNDNYNLNVLKEKNTNLKKAYKAYGKNVDDFRELKHNLKSDLYFLKTSIPNKYHKQINELIVKYNKNSEWINKMGDIPEGLQGIIFLKEEEAKRNNVKIIINSFENPKTTLKDYLELCNIINILLDNAIEASKNGNYKIIAINIKEDKDKLLISIINEFSNVINIDKIGLKNYSTKVYKSGLGINYIKKINNEKISVNFKIINNIFISEIHYKL